MSTARRLLGQAVKATAAGVDLVRRPAPGVVVLIYHRVGTGTGSEIDLPTERFDEQMAWLAQQRRPVSLDEAVELLEGADVPNGPPPVVVTFDDGTVDFVDHAVPVLDRHRVPATLYLATDFAERQQTFPPDATPVTWSGAGRRPEHRPGHDRLPHPHPRPARPAARRRGGRRARPVHRPDRRTPRRGGPSTSPTRRRSPAPPPLMPRSGPASAPPRWPAPGPTRYGTHRPPPPGPLPHPGQRPHAVVPAQGPRRHGGRGRAAPGPEPAPLLGRGDVTT